ncbi:hypothetical protein RvY_05268 [Ramazzottius varieornatus]|uniref:DNA polymerase delta subunit 2 n=1 Tax=Ramazzottius varieornatus TaxID=947166 RepID=A0A1D1UUH1_RAMVA|nr:hypothetical protein RvY_05268 [Ramazzottius varieornatus]
MEDKPKLQRAVCQVDDVSDRFRLDSARNFRPQYANIYFQRLAVMRDRVESAAQKRWGSNLPLKKLSDLEPNELGILVGTLYKEMEMKPSILKEISEDTEVPVQPILPRYTQDNDTLLLEEESQRIVLVGNIDMHQLVTGITIALLGYEDDEGKFQVKEYGFADIPPQAKRPIPEADCYIGFISGLGLGPASAPVFALDMCIEMLTGQLGTEEEQRKMSQIGALVIAGSLIIVAEDDRREHAKKAKYLARNATVGSIEGMLAVDEMLSQIAACMDVYVMPGANDPGNYMLPQRALHYCMFPMSNKSSGLHLVTNPFEADFNGIRILGTSGQNISDIYRNSRIEDPLVMMGKTVQWTHLAPTAPDTLACVPFLDRDPFILDDTPHVYFAGNQASAGHRWFKGNEGQRILLVSIPEYHRTPVLTLLNLRSMKVETMSFEDAIQNK